MEYGCGLSSDIMWDGKQFCGHKRSSCYNLKCFGKCLMAKVVLVMEIIQTHAKAFYPIFASRLGSLCPLLNNRYQPVQNDSAVIY